MNQKETKWLRTRHETMAEVNEGDRGGDHKEEEEGQSRFEEENNREVGFFRIDTYVSEVVVDVPGCDAGEDFGDADQVLSEWQEEGRMSHVRNDGS